MTYSKTTQMSSGGAIPVGMDQPAHLKFQTSSGLNHIQHNPDAHEKVSQIVGVNRSQDTYVKVRVKFVALPTANKNSNNVTFL